MAAKSRDRERKNKKKKKLIFIFVTETTFSRKENVTTDKPNSSLKGKDHREDCMTYCVSKK